MTKFNPHDLVPLKSIFPSWSGKVVPEAFNRIRRGVEIEGRRFSCKPFLVVLRQRDIDYDGMMISIRLIEGFASEGEAALYAANCATAARQSLLKEPTDGSSRWRTDEGLWAPGFCTEMDTEYVQCLSRDRIMARTDSGYDSKYLEFAVLHVTAAEVIGPELISYLGLEDNVVAYFGEHASARSTLLEK